MANVIYRGPLDKDPVAVNLPVSGAYLPGCAVEDTGAALTQLTTAIGKRVHVLGNVAFKEQTVADAYASGDTGIGYEANPNDVFHARLAAATYAVNDALTVGASGRFTKATSGDKVVAVFNDTAGAYTADALADVVFVDGYIVPAA
ncbi:hypothetical protein [Litorimonas haliclonae]|uniref:hypothetical protein n=1 Tax=Litorimonas haliclonae TaxID=2081977 RepID=UPI0039F0EEBA